MYSMLFLYAEEGNTLTEVYYHVQKCYLEGINTLAKANYFSTRNEPLDFHDFLFPLFSGQCSPLKWADS